MRSCAIFDLDGTLINSLGDLAASVNHTRSLRQLPPLPVAQIGSYVGEGPVVLLERSFFDAPGTDIEQLLPLYKEYYRSHMANLTAPYPGIPEGLAELHATGIPMAVVTNKHSEAVLGLLKKFNLAGYFNIIIGSGSGFPPKPEPGALLHILKEFGADPAQSWMIGDHFTDLESGRRAGMKRALAVWGFGNPKDEIPDFKAANVPELVREIKKSL